MRCAKTAEPIEMPFGMWTRVGPMKHILDGGCTFAPPGEYDWAVHVRRQCGLSVRLLWLLVTLFVMTNEMTCDDSGFYPRGGGEVVVEANPIPSLRCVELLDRGNVVQVTGRAFVAGTLPVRVRWPLLLLVFSGLQRWHTRDLHQFFCACCLWLWLGPPLAGWQGGILGVFLPTDSAL